MSEHNKNEQDQNLPAEETPSVNEEPTETAEALEAYESFSEEIDVDANTENSAEIHSLNIDQAPLPSEEQVRIQLLESQVDGMKDQMVRALADAENTRKRARKEREDASKFAVSNFARDILSVADNLRRALDAVPVELMAELPQVKNLIDGIEATERELLRSFEKNGITKINPMGEKFNPNFHEVMFEAPMPDKEHGTIIQVIDPGYMINGRILRPARVGIAKSHENIPPKGPGHTIDTEA